ncbi:hypothetical protein [Salibacterium lacus]|uniref:Uncharacterized protein n=1 Tax=Salibacterium lacus TaxID=1898109 RepID=A0ABW5SY70_9BACI
MIGRPNLDRFAEGLADPQAQPEIVECDACGAEIYDEAEICTGNFGIGDFCADCWLEKEDEEWAKLTE